MHDGLVKTMRRPVPASLETGGNDRRIKFRFEIRRDLRYKVLGGGKGPQAGEGSTLNISSGGVAFHADKHLEPGSFVELSISWPALLDGVCAMRLCIFGRVLRARGHRAACTVDRYEFRTQSPARNSTVVVDSTVLPSTAESASFRPGAVRA